MKLDKDTKKSIKAMFSGIGIMFAYWLVGKKFWDFLDMPFDVALALCGVLTMLTIPSLVIMTKKK